LVACSNLKDYYRLYGMSEMVRGEKNSSVWTHAYWTVEEKLGV